MKTLLKRIFYWYRLVRSCDNFRELSRGVNVIIGPGTKMYPVKYIGLGDNVFIGRNVTISTSSSGQSPITMGSNIMIAERVMIIGGNHNISRIDIPINQQGEGKQGQIVLEDDVWIGAGCIILTGVKIGKGSVIGAGSVVTKSVPEYSIAVGNPARVIRQR